MAISLAILSPLSVQAKAPAGRSSATKNEIADFRNWRVGCDNVRTCRAYSVKDDTDNINLTYQDYDAQLILDRRGGPDARPTFRLHQNAGHAAAIEWNGGKNMLPLKALDDQTLAEADGVELLEALRSQPSLMMVDRNHHLLGPISLTGASAALLRMDDLQHRVNTVTALARPGALPASTIAAPPPPPVIHAARLSRKPAATFDRAVTARLVGRDQMCADKDFAADQTEFDRLDAGHTLAIVTLGCPTGFNAEGALFVIADGSKSLPREAEITAQDDIQWMWDKAGQVLSEGIDNHGPNDENAEDEYVWTGRAFAHSESHVLYKGESIITYRAVVIRDR